MIHRIRSRSRLRLLAALTVLVAFTGCAEAKQNPMAPTRPATSIGDGLFLVPLLTNTTETLLNQVIGSAGGVLDLTGGSSIAFPAGALPANTTITAVRDGDDLKIDLGPEGLVFPDSALPTLTFDYGAAAPDSAVIVYLDDNGWLSEVLETRIDSVAHLAQAKIRHFSTYALATD